MAVELANYIDGLDPSQPVGSDSLGESDDNHRLLKKTVTQTFAGMDGDRWDTALLVGPRFLNSLEENLNLSFYVTLTTAQTISGIKTFSEPIVSGVKNAGGRTAVSGNSEPVFGDQVGQTILSSSNGTNLTHRTPDGDAAVITSETLAAWIWKVWPVGSVIFNTGVNPETLYPFTVWTQRAQGRFIVGVGSGNDGTTPRSYGSKSDSIGRYKVTLNESQMPAHVHDIDSTTKVGAYMDALDADQFGFVPGGTPQGNTNSAGGSAAHENSPPAYGLYVWERTA